LSEIIPASLPISASDPNVNLCVMQAALSDLVARVPSAVRPDIATPKFSSILNSLFCADESSDAARFKVASTT